MSMQGPIAVVDADAALAATEGDHADRAIVVERCVPAPAAQLFRLWTTSDGLSGWLSPGARVELQLGGAFEVLFDKSQPIGSQGSEGCRVLAFLEPRMLAFTWNAPPHLDRTRAQRTHVVVEFVPEGDSTLVRLTHAGWPDAAWTTEPEWPETFSYFEAAWPRVLAALAEHISG
ncbi:MAG: SRPBCC domain-containing protein [Sandaracinaceae bacterium]